MYNNEVIFKQILLQETRQKYSIKVLFFNTGTIISTSI